MQSDTAKSPPASQAIQHKGLTKGNASGCKSEEGQLVSGLFLELENDPDFRRIAERWGQLSDELKEAVLRLVR